MVKPYTLSNHPFGVFTSRFHHSFNKKPVSKQLSFTISRGNVWLPNAQSILVNNKAYQKILSNYKWHHRNGVFNSWNTSDYKSRVLDADGIFSSYHLNYTHSWNEKWEENIAIKFISLTGGNIPYSLLTSDQFIEWFHDNIAGGKDPFGRRKKNFNRSKFYYKDLNNKSVNISNNSSLLSEITIQTKYYSNLKLLGFKQQFQPFLGVNQFQNIWSANAGMGWSATKIFSVFNKNLLWGIGSSFVGTDVFSSAPANFNNKGWIADLEMHWQYCIPRDNRLDFCAINYHLQSAFHKDRESKYNVIRSENLSSHGHMAVSHLNRPIQGWSFLLGTTIKQTSITCFLREDFVVDNAPDGQVGWNITINFN